MMIGSGSKHNKLPSSDLIFVQRYDDDNASASCHFVERNTQKIYAPSELPAGSPVWLEYYDNEHNCNYYQHSVSKEKVWTLDEIDAAEDEARHSIGVDMGMREKKSASSSPSRRNSLQQLLPISSKSSSSTSITNNKKKKKRSNEIKNNENQHQHNRTVSSDSDTDSNSSDSDSSESESDDDDDATTVTKNKRTTPLALKTSPPRGRRGNKAKARVSQHNSFDPAVQDVSTPSKNKLRKEKGSERRTVEVVDLVKSKSTSKSKSKSKSKSQIKIKTKKSSKRTRHRNNKKRNPDKKFDHDGSVTFAMYTFMVFFHGAICESPAAALECLIRSMIHFLKAIAFTVLVLTKRTDNAWNQAIFQFREAFICMCTFPSLLLLFPGGLVYRNFDALEPWNVTTIWTLCGRVDPRRFSAFTFGQGSDAKNVLSNKFPRDAMDDLPMPSAIESSKYRRVSIGDGVPMDLRRRKGRNRKKKKRRTKKVVSESDNSSDSEYSSDSSSDSDSDSSSDEDRRRDRRRGDGREVVLELPDMGRVREIRRGERV